MEIETDYLSSVKKQFAYYKLLGEKTFEQLSDAELLWQSDSEANSIAIIVKHLHGNMRSRWTDLFTTDGEKEWRERDAEFVGDLTGRGEMMKLWAEGWSCLFTSLETIDSRNFHELIYIRNMGHTVIEAINRQLAHYAYHVGQIVFLGRIQKKESWTSLSIAKGGSKSFNSTKFSIDKRKGHFTEDYLDKEKKG